jgi:C_GCAxxG_C_C family probable redox protein
MFKTSRIMTVHENIPISPDKKKLKPRIVFWKRGACSNAMFHLLNHEFGQNLPLEEKASDMLAGGIAQRGHQCGMLWGAALAAGSEAGRIHSDKNQAIAAAVNASKALNASFQQRTGTLNCRDITHVDWQDRLDRNVYILKTIARGFIYSPCFNLMSHWTPEAVAAAKAGLTETTNCTEPCKSCATEVVKKMGASEEESVMVAGFAGGLGLSGEGCGALSAAIWYKMLDWGRKNPGKKPSMFNNPEAKKVLEAFVAVTGGEMNCKVICNRKFSSAEEHSEFIRKGGCRIIIETLAVS